MNRGGKFLISTTLLALAGCGGDMGKLEIRSTPSKLARGAEPVAQRIAEARGQLALGNVGLALEAFRIAAREDPNSTDALLGIATCYDQMGRYDLSRRSYEAALAIAPADPKLLGAFAASLDVQGRTDEAFSVRQEIAARAAASAATAATEQASAAPVPDPVTPVAAATVANDQSLQIAAAPEPELAARSWAAPAVNVTAPAPEPVAVSLPKGETGRVEIAAREPAPAPALTPAPVADAPVQTAAAGPSVTVKLPPARTVQAAPVAVAATSTPKQVAPAPAAATRPPTKADRAPVQTAEVTAPPFKPSFRSVSEPSFLEERGPRLERVSMGEIALVTVPRPQWRATTVARTEHSTKIRFVPVREASTLPARVRLLNAARVDRLAARTRSWLVARGWQGMRIGNASSTRAASLILYPADQRWLAYKLSRQFGFAMAKRPTASQVTVLLGSDAARHPALRRRSA